MKVGCAGTWAETVLNDLVADPSGRANALNAHPDIARRLRDDYLAWHLVARAVNLGFKPLSEQGSAILSGDDLQRSPGRNGYTFAIGVYPADGDDSDAAAAGNHQVILEQAERFRIQTSKEHGITLDVLGQTLAGMTGAMPTPPISASMQRGRSVSLAHSVAPSF